MLVTMNFIFSYLTSHRFRLRHAVILFTSHFLLLTSYAQKVGLVLSGGGASGIAHIGVMKALEENNIPIDYITGTSIGALVGGMYAVGYSPAYLEQMVKTEAFKNLAYGKVDNKYIYYFKNKDENASWITFKLSLDSIIEPTIPTNIVSSVPIDLKLMELFSAPAALAKYNFDSLFIPFRCVASDVEAKKSVIFNKGDLNQAVRASLSYPFYIKPIPVNGKLLFDGGLYNNFPSDIMYADCFPDFIIGSNVTGNAPPPDEDNVLSQIRSMLVSKTNYNVLCENGIIIEPKTDVALFDFDNPQELIDSGYAMAMRQMPQIKEIVERRVSKEELDKKRAAFFKFQQPINFSNINVEGLNPKQANYIRKVIEHKSKIITIENFRPEYFRLAADERIKHIFPTAKYNDNGYYDLNLRVKKEKDLITFFGGNFSNRPINMGYVGLQYNYFRKIAATVTGNTYFGKLYSSVQAKIRLDFPFRIPIYIEPNVTYNRWDYFKSSYKFFEDLKPPYLLQRDKFAELNLGVPARNKGKFIAAAGIGNLTYQYYQIDKFTQTDTADRTDFNLFTSNLMYEFNSQNRKQYASEGSHFLVSARYINGQEDTQPGSTAIDKSKFRKTREWFQYKVIFDTYYKRRGTLRLGVYFESVFSTQPFFENYTASILAAPAFQAIPESKTIFQEAYRAHKYISGGLKNVISIKKNIDLRIEGYIFVPYESIVKDINFKAIYGGVFETKRYVATVAAVYHTPLGPLSFSVNAYDKDPQSFSFLFHMGYILFNRRITD